MKKIPLCKAWIDEEERQAVLEVLESGWLTHGPKNKEFEAIFKSVWVEGIFWGLVVWLTVSQAPWLVDTLQGRSMVKQNAGKAISEETIKLQCGGDVEPGADGLMGRLLFCSSAWLGCGVITPCLGRTGTIGCTG